MFSSLVVKFLSICGIYGSDTSAREGHSAVVPFFGGEHDDTCFEVSKVSVVKGRW